MSKPSLPFGLTLKHSLSSHSLYFTIIKDCVEILTHNIPCIEKLKTNNELLLLICRCVKIKNNKISDLDEVELVVAIYDELFETMTDAERDILRGNIKFLEQNGKIKGVSMFKTISAAVMDWCSRRIL